jgi:hypothetical protein
MTSSASLIILGSSALNARRLALPLTPWTVASDSDLAPVEAKRAASLNFCRRRPTGVGDVHPTAIA